MGKINYKRQSYRSMVVLHATRLRRLLAALCLLQDGVMTSGRWWRPCVTESTRETQNELVPLCVNINPAWMPVFRLNVCIKFFSLRQSALLCVYTLILLMLYVLCILQCVCSMRECVLCVCVCGGKCVRNSLSVSWRGALCHWHNQQRLFISGPEFPPLTVLSVSGQDPPWSCKKRLHVANKTSNTE